MRHGTLRLELAAKEGRSQFGRLAWFAIALAITAIPEGTFASTQEIPAFDVTIQFKGRGGLHVFPALESAATEAALTCVPSIEDYAQGNITDGHGKARKIPNQMRCGFGSSGTIRANELTHAPHGQIQLLVYYELPPRNTSSLVKPKIDALVANVEAVLKADPSIQAIDQLADINNYPVSSKIK